MKYLWMCMLIVPELIGCVMSVYDIASNYKESKKPYNRSNFWERLDVFTQSFILFHVLIGLAFLFAYSIMLYTGGVE